VAENVNQTVKVGDAVKGAAEGVNQTVKAQWTQSRVQLKKLPDCKGTVDVVKVQLIC